MTFKELYLAAARRHPEHCQMRNGKVNLGEMGWIREIHQDLEKVGVNRNGLWHLRTIADVSASGGAKMGFNRGANAKTLI